jgi:hypothetical protein
MLAWGYSTVGILSRVLAVVFRVRLGDSFLFSFQRGCEVHPRSYGRLPGGGGSCLEGIATGKSSSTIHLRPVRRFGMRGAITPQHVFVQRSLVKWSNITIKCLYNLCDINTLCWVKKIQCDLCKQTNHNVAWVICDAASWVQKVPPQKCRRGGKELATSIVNTGYSYLSSQYLHGERESPWEITKLLR